MDALLTPPAVDPPCGGASGEGVEPRVLRAVPAPEALHPTLWRAHQLGRSREETVPSGFPALDAELPGGGWPRRALSELLLPQLGIGEMRLLAPALQQVTAAGRVVMLFDPPAMTCGAGFAQLGIDVQQLVLVQPHAKLRGHARELLPSADVLWALEQALKSGHVGAVLAWLPSHLRIDVLRRLQLAAQAQEGPAFLLRDASARARPSPAPLRLSLQSAGADVLAVRVLKRRGPALPEALQLALRPVLPASVRERSDAASQPLPVPA
ncbi:MAG TPA: translesion DNA synthesis-associated protein ImuA [Burkholderiaceae bacterium]|nr:translesion DNA synthesis-associated protein ImuA [Burkholderiaceae bacterium]